MYWETTPFGATGSDQTTITVLIPNRYAFTSTGELAGAKKEEELDLRQTKKSAVKAKKRRFLFNKTEPPISFSFKNATNNVKNIRHYNFSERKTTASCKVIAGENGKQLSIVGESANIYAMYCHWR